VKKPLPSISVVLHEESFFKGRLVFKNAMKICGKFEGTIESPGFLFIEDGADIKADIKIGSIVVGGKVNGDIDAAERVELLSSAKINGNIKTKGRLKVGDGVQFDGRCDMIRVPGSLDIFSTALPQLKRSLSDIPESESR
jgi:cytoskeletal protein CcmA (bactofilin family)